MNKFIAAVKVNNQLIKTVVFADSATHARLLLQYQFGMSSVAQGPVATNEDVAGYKQIDEVISMIKPLKPEQARLSTLKRQKDSATKALKSERDRQKVSRAHQQIRSVIQKKS